MSGGAADLPEKIIYNTIRISKFYKLLDRVKLQYCVGSYKSVDFSLDIIRILYEIESNPYSLLRYTTSLSTSFLLVRKEVIDDWRFLLFDA